MSGLSVFLLYIFTAFKNLKSLPKNYKEEIYNQFCDLILEKQLWKYHEIDVGDGKMEKLNREILKGKIAKFAQLDFGNNKLKMFSNQERVAMNDGEVSDNENKNEIGDAKKIAATPSSSTLPAIDTSSMGIKHTPDKSK